MFGTKDGLTFPNNFLGDYAGGSALCALGIVLALFERKNTNKGQIVDSSITEGVMYLISLAHGLKIKGFDINERGKNYLDGGVPFYQTYKCKGTFSFQILFFSFF